VQELKSKFPSPSRGKVVNKGKVSGSALLSKAELYKKVVERETLVKLIITTNVALKRKDMIMEAIEACHEKLRRAKSGHGVQLILSDRRCQVFKDYYGLLQINLRLNEEALETALVYLQIMYGKAYAGDPITSPPVFSSDYLDSQFQVDHPSDIGKKWASSFLGGSLKVGSAIARQMERKAADISLKPLIETAASGCRKQVLEHRMASALGLLQTIDLIEVITNEKHGSTSHVIPADHHTVTNILHSATEMLQPLKIPRLPQNVMDVLPSSDCAVKALSEAVRMLLIEFLVSV